MTNQMKQIRIEKITLNIGAGKDQKKLEKGITLLKNITGISPVKTFSKKRIPSWGLRLGLPIGCKITLRKNAAKDLLKRLLKAIDGTLKMSQFDYTSNVAFGIPEYIDIEGVKYDPSIGMMGLEACVTLERPGYRIKKRNVQKKRIGKKHLITKEEAIEFMKKEFNARIGESE